VSQKGLRYCTGNLSLGTSINSLMIRVMRLGDSNHEVEDTYHEFDVNNHETEYMNDDI
jgi:hypothetical protein